MSEDQAIVAAVLAGEPGAFERLIQRHQALVWHMVYRMVANPEDARELCQDVFLRVHDRLRQYRFESSLATWIGRVAFNIATRHLQKKKIAWVSADEDEGESSEYMRASDGFDLAEACADQELMQHLGAEIERLPALQRTLVTLYHLDELGIGDIAASTGLPEGTVKNYLFRARQKLRQGMEQRLGVMA
jgi:RNA polymerase sigma-70 factor (ECF subfamily)